MSLPSDVQAAVAVVCPVVGVSIGDQNDKSTWRVDFTPDATDAQKAAAAQAITNYDLVAPKRSACLDALSARRWKAQTSATYDGVSPVAYGADTPGSLLAAMQALGTQPTGTTGPWKLGDGAYRTWTLPQFQTFFAWGVQYVNACFANEAALAAQIAAASDPTTVNIETGWPT